MLSSMAQAQGVGQHPLAIEQAALNQLAAGFLARTTPGLGTFAHPDAMQIVIVQLWHRRLAPIWRAFLSKNVRCMDRREGSKSVVPGRRRLVMESYRLNERGRQAPNSQETPPRSPHDWHPINETQNHAD
jgi:hypothetical protein